MSVNGISSYTSNMTLTAWRNQTAAENSGLLDKTGASGSSPAYGSNLASAAGKAALERALGEITPNSNGKITYQMISEHQAKLEKEFTALVKVGLLLEGVPEDADFKLIATSDGKMKVVSDDPEIQKAVEEYFAENEDLEEDFLYIQALGNLARTQTGLESNPAAQRMNVRDIKAGLQAQAWSLFFEDSVSSGFTGYSSLIADFSSENVSYLLGANCRV